jgi:hypothetical protein
MLWQTRLPPALHHKDEFAYEFVNSGGRVICSSWYPVRARHPCHTSGDVPYRRKLPADYDVERALVLT